MSSMRSFGNNMLGSALQTITKRSHPVWASIKVGSPRGIIATLSNAGSSQSNFIPWRGWSTPMDQKYTMIDPGFVRFRSRSGHQKKSGLKIFIFLKEIVFQNLWRCFFFNSSTRGRTNFKGPAQSAAESSGHAEKVDPNMTRQVFSLLLHTCYIA